MERHNIERETPIPLSALFFLLSLLLRPTFAPSAPKKLMIPPPHCQGGGTAAEHVGGEFSGRRHRFSGLELSLPLSPPHLLLSGGFSGVVCPTLPDYLFRRPPTREGKEEEREATHRYRTAERSRKRTKKTFASPKLCTEIAQ